MQLGLSPEQVQLLRELVEPVNLVHFSEGCEPPGYSIVISFGGPYGNDAVGRCGNQTVQLGEVGVYPAQDAWMPADEARQRADQGF